jgi:hypothetical protein
VADKVGYLEEIQSSKFPFPCLEPPQKKRKKAPGYPDSPIAAPPSEGARIKGKRYNPC